MSLATKIVLSFAGFWALVILGILALWFIAVRIIRACEQLWEGEL